MKNKYGQIYLHTNILNGKTYVGKTTQTLERRCRFDDPSHRSYENCVLFKRALDKHGWKNFVSITLEYGDNLEELNKLETFFLQKYDSANPDKGYNIQSVSEGPGKHSEETKEKLRQKQVAFNKRQKEMGMIKVSPKRRDHTMINNVEGKLCTGTEPNHWVPLTGFGAKPDTWDGLLHDCRECRKKAMREYRKLHPPKKLTPEAFQASYIGRSNYNKKKA